MDRPSRLVSLVGARAAVRPALGVGIGLVGVAAVVGLFVALHSDSVRVIEGLVLVVPVIVAALVGGRRASYIVAVVATAAFTFIIPPFGSLRIEVVEDVAALAVFGAVAVVVGSLVAGRIEALEAIERQREELLRAVSHDFRTPLSVISAVASDLAQSPDYDEATRVRLLTLVDDESRRLDRLVRNLLDIGRIRAGALRPDRQAVDVAELVAHSTGRLRRILDDVDLVVALDDDLPVLWADFTQLDQVLTNLLENAVRHHPPGSRVRLTARRTADGVRITVADDGPGVDPAVAERLFEPFRSGSGPGSVPGSSGVGLAICRAVVEAHGGTIAFAPVTRGAEVVVELPVGAPPAV